ncbi:MAG: hypothetical protein AAF682_04085 [Planctomycetota bacterium]
MLRTTSLVLLTAGVTALVCSQPAGAGGAPAVGGITNEPMVVFDVTGPTFAGSIHEHLAVYNNGFVTISKRNDNPFGNLDVDVQTANVGADGALKLLLDLIGSGAVTLPDQSGTASDIPLTTLTIAEGQEIALSRTFSYWSAPQYNGVAGVMNDFISTTFPGF